MLMKLSIASKLSEKERDVVVPLIIKVRQKNLELNSTLFGLSCEVVVLA